MKNAFEIEAILPTKGNQALLAAGSTIDDLLAGQIGFFNTNTKTSFVHTQIAANPALLNNFVVMLGTGKVAADPYTDLRQSAGAHIQGFGITNLKVQCAKACEANVVDLSGFKVTCNSTPVVGVVIDTQTAFVEHGAAPVRKVYTPKVDCCTDDGIPNPNQFAIALRDEINNDAEGLFTAVIYLGLETPPEAGEEVVVTSDATILGWDPDTELAVVRVYGNCGKIKEFCCINWTYAFPPGIVMTWVGRSGLDCGFTATEIREIQYALGSGYDMAQQEYFDQGWMGGGVYRQTESGVDIQGGQKLVDPEADYVVFNLEHTVYNAGGFRELSNPGQTVIPIPCGDTTTIAAVANVFDAIATAQRIQTLDTFVNLSGDCLCPGVEPEPEPEPEP